ncbi:anaerobic ribonucleoside-triphosphate reductase activating protein, partial [gut metagenome]
HPDLLTEADLLTLAESLRDQGVETWALQIYRRPPGLKLVTLPTVGDDYPSAETMARFRALFKTFIFRPAQ